MSIVKKHFALFLDESICTSTRYAWLTCYNLFAGVSTVAISLILCHKTRKSVTEVAKLVTCFCRW